MKKLRVIARVIILNPEKNKIILVRNKGTRFWYPPGGGWEYGHESIRDAAVREVREEVGIDITIDRLLYNKEFSPDNDTLYFETFWLAYYQGQLPKNHISDGAVEDVAWFTQDDLQDITVFPERLKNIFWSELETLNQLKDQFIV